jgi:hypothetical protein
LSLITKTTHGARYDLSTSAPPALAEDVVVDKKRKHVNDIASSSSAAVGKALIRAEDTEYFDML